MFAHDVVTLFQHTIQLFKGTNHKQVIPTLIVAHDPIDKMVEKEMNPDKIYIKQMHAWIKEQEARREQIVVTIKTSSEIVEQNKIQLQWLDKGLALAKEEFENWKKENQ